MNSLEKKKLKISRNINASIKEIPISKTIHNEFKILFPKRFTSTNNINLRKKNKKDSFLFLRNKFINKTKVVTRINSSKNKNNFIISYNSKSRFLYNPTIIQSNQNIDISRNRTLNNSKSNFFYYITYRNNIKRKHNIYLNKIEKSNILKNKINNTSLYNYSMNTSNNSITKNNSNAFLKSNEFEISSRNKFIIAAKEQLKNKILKEKIKNAILGINKIIPPVIKLNTKKNKFEKSYKNIKVDLRNNNPSKANISHNNQSGTNDIINLKFKYNEKCIKDIETKKKTGMNNKKGLNETIIKEDTKEEKINTGLSTYTTKIEEDGLLELNQVQDLIIYYKLDKESGKNYLFEKNDYANFIENRIKKYLRFYVS